MFYVYLLKLSNNTVYTGSSDNLKKRFEKHQHGECLATRNFRPVILLWYCAFPTRKQARRFEDYLKTGSGQAFRNKHLINSGGVA